MKCQNFANFIGKSTQSQNRKYMPRYAPGQFLNNLMIYQKITNNKYLQQRILGKMKNIFLIFQTFINSTCNSIDVDNVFKGIVKLLSTFYWR